jgi:DNA-directed RNA polymerase specialized sigma24 family protein
LVQRYGPLVLRVARRTLLDYHAAEDVFQATFLVLACRASSIRKRKALGSWLTEVPRSGPESVCYPGPQKRNPVP